MFRQSLRRCANQARGTASAALLVQTRAALPITRQHILPSLSRTVAPLTRIALVSRPYSTEAAAEIAEAPKPAADGKLAKFADLSAAGVHDNLVYSIVEDMKYDDMTPVQAMTIGPALKGTDIVAQAKTGTGKTLAFLLPLLQRMIDEDPSLAERSAARHARSNDIRGIVLSPTRELAEQIAVEARRLVKHTGLVVQCAVGGTDKSRMLNQTRRQGCHLLVATPGRLHDLLSDPRSGIEAPNLAALVLDEADRMLDVGFERELNQIMELLPAVREKVRQTMLVSATIPDDVIRLARSMVRPQDFEFVQTISENESLTHDKVPQHIVPVSSWVNVFPALLELVDREVAKSKEDPDARPFKAIVYLNTTYLVELAGEILRQRHTNNRASPRTFMMQSKLSQQQRQRAADSFRKVTSGVLVSSDVTARGMDFPNVTHVIQLDAPRDRESYIHRLGRTGRQNKEGEGWLLIPHVSIQAARKTLRALPIKQNNSLETAEFEHGDRETGETTPIHRECKELYDSMPRGLLGAVYKSMFGVAADKVALAEDIHHWIEHGWGAMAAPPVSLAWAKHMGLAGYPGINTQKMRPFDREPQHTRDYDRVERGSGPPRWASKDPFSSMKSKVHRDPHGSKRARNVYRNGGEGSSF